MKWFKAFADNIDTNDIHIDQYLWHIFSYKRLNCLEGEEADARLISIKKKSLYVFFNNEKTCYELRNAMNFHPDDIRYYTDIYVTDKDFSWTYVITHETGSCGPYFYSK
ncbi:DUF4275 family protein [Clostridium tetanomorphum]|uniref:DUF4275 family protein n=1 Tax=Clostridium tetanomorphum TaxID=1553 RepID=UPI0030B820C5